MSIRRLHQLAWFASLAWAGRDHRAAEQYLMELVAMRLLADDVL